VGNRFTGIPQHELDNELERDTSDEIAALLRKRLLIQSVSLFFPTVHAMLYEPVEYAEELSAVQEVFAYGKQLVKTGEMRAVVDNLASTLVQKIPSLSNTAERRLFDCGLFGLEPFVIVQQLAENGFPVTVTFGCQDPGGDVDRADPRAAGGG
jgi:hypothetical protein